MSTFYFLNRMLFPLLPKFCTTLPPGSLPCPLVFKVYSLGHTYSNSHLLLKTTIPLVMITFLFLFRVVFTCTVFISLLRGYISHFPITFKCWEMLYYTFFASFLLYTQKLEYCHVHIERSITS